MNQIHLKLSSSFKWISRLIVLILGIFIVQLIILLFSKDYDLIKFFSFLTATFTIVSFMLIARFFWRVSEDFMHLSNSFIDQNRSSDAKIDDVNDPEVLNELINRINRKK